MQKLFIFLTLICCLLLLTMDSRHGDEEFKAPENNLEISRPYDYSSLSSLEDEKLEAWMGGKPFYQYERDMQPRNRIPDNFWELPPKEAALAFAKINHSDENRKYHKLHFKKNVVEPEGPFDIELKSDDAHYSLLSDKGRSYLVYRWDSYYWDSGAFPGKGGIYDIQILPLEDADAEHAAKVIFWLKQLTSKYTPEKETKLVWNGFWLDIQTSETWGGLCSISSTADGHGNLSFRQPKKTLFTFSGTTWLTIDSIAERWGSEFNDEVRLNFIDYLIYSHVTKRSDRWIQPTWDENEKNSSRTTPAN